MSDLRTGLVEAMAKAMLSHDYPMQYSVVVPYELSRAAAALDAAIGFLTDNATETVHVEYRAGFTKADALENICVEELIAALSDSRDTGEKP